MSEPTMEQQHAAEVLENVAKLQAENAKIRELNRSRAELLAACKAAFSCKNSTGLCKNCRESLRKCIVNAEKNP
jgi:hypothetical protein